MYYQASTARDKYEKLNELSDEQLLDRIRQFLYQDLLNTDLKSMPRNVQPGTIAEQFAGKELDAKTRHNLISAFSSITTLGVTTQDRPIMPDNVDGFPLWNFNKGGFDGFKLKVGLVEEAPGHIAVTVPTTDVTTVKVGYLDERLVDAYHISGDQIASGQWYKGQLEVVLDAEELYERSRLEPAVTEDGKYRYEMPFKIANIQYETSKWEGHEANPGIIKTFEENMNTFPVKEMVGSMLERNGLDNPVTDVTWHMESNDSNLFQMELLSDTRLDGSQLLCIDNTLSYITCDSAYQSNAENHIFGDYMEKDDIFIKTVHNTFETQMVPDRTDVFRRQLFREVMAEPELVLTNEDLKGLDSVESLSV